MTDITAEEIMRREVLTVEPDLPLSELEEYFFSAGVNGFPVVKDGELVGVVSRSDIVRQLCDERHVARLTSDFYRDGDGFHEQPKPSLTDIADRVGERIEKLCVKDVMQRHIHKEPRDQPLNVVAQVLLDNEIHRVLVMEKGRLLCIVTTSDIVRLHAQPLKPSGRHNQWAGSAGAFVAALTTFAAGFWLGLSFKT